MSYTDTLILVAEDCPARSGTVPVARAQGKSVAVIQYELLSASPYRFTHEDLLWEVHVRHKLIAEEAGAESRAVMRAALLAKNHPCLRASPLPKTYGWGVHCDGAGRIAVYSSNSEEYRRLSAGNTVKAMRSRRG